MSREVRYIDYYSDRTTILRFVAMSLAFALVIVLGFGARFYLQTEFDALDFWGDLGFSMSLSVYCMFIGVPEARDNYHKKKDGRYQVCMGEFKKIRSEVSPKDSYFDEWLDVYYKEQRDDFYRQMLTVKGVTNYKVLELDASELDNLRQPYHKEWPDGTSMDFRSLTEDQIDEVRRILTGKIKVKKIPNDTFKTANGKVATNEYVSQSRKEGKEAMTYAALVISRLVLMFLISLILVIFGIRLSEAGDKEQLVNQIVDTIGRLWTMISSYMYGFSIGRMMVTNECDRIEFKTRVNSLFNSRSKDGIMNV